MGSGAVTAAGTSISKSLCITLSPNEMSYSNLLARSLVSCSIQLVPSPSRSLTTVKTFSDGASRFGRKTEWRRFDRNLLSVCKEDMKTLQESLTLLSQFSRSTSSTASMMIEKFPSCTKDINQRHIKEFKGKSLLNKQSDKNYLHRYMENDTSCRETRPIYSYEELKAQRKQLYINYINFITHTIPTVLPGSVSQKIPKGFENFYPRNKKSNDENSKNES